MSKRIEVTQDDLDTGVQGSFYFCAVALAAQRAYPDANIGVGEFRMYIDRREIALPPDVISRISLYDDGIDVEPFSFEV